MLRVSKGSSVAPPLAPFLSFRKENPCHQAPKAPLTLTMAPAHTAARFSTHLAIQPSTLCIQCQFLASRPFSTGTPKLTRRTSRPFSTLPPHLASRTLKERLWREPDSPSPESPSSQNAAGGVGEALGQAEYKPAVTWDDLPSVGGNPGAEWERDHIWEG